MRIHHLNCGTFHTPFKGRAKRAGNGSPASRGVCHCLLIETDDGLVLVDTGIGLADIASPAARMGREFLMIARPVLDPAETAIRQVERLGYRAADVRHIVLTHLDLDHTGGLGDFPDARVHVHATELDSARHPMTLLERRRYQGHQWDHGPHWVEHGTGGDTWHGFSAVRDLPGLPPSILLIPLAGHTRGHIGVAVDTGDSRWLLHAGDAYFFHGQLDPDRPHCPPDFRAFQFLMQSDQSSRLHNLRRLRELDANPAIQIFSAHDAVEYAQAIQTPARTPTAVAPAPA